MKKILSLTIIMLLAATAIFAQGMKKTPASPHETISGNHIKVTYGRPYKKGRDIFGGLVPYNKVWRAGADEATEVTFDKDCTFIGRPVTAGTYTLFAIPGKSEWTIILNSQLGQWGSFKYDEYKDKDVVKAAVAAKHINNTVEQFTIKIENDGLRMEWDKTSVFLPVKF